jgi:hypothetical protein
MSRPCTDEQASRAVLRLINSPLVADVTDAGATLEGILSTSRIVRLSGGERRLVLIAKSIWNGQGADIADLERIDRHNARLVWLVLGYWLFGEDDFEHEDRERLFGERVVPV